MIKQLTILAITAAFGLAHAADGKPTVEVKPAATPAAVTTPAATQAKSEAAKIDSKPVEVKKEAAPAAKHEGKEHHDKGQHKGEAKKADSKPVETAKPVEPAKK